MSHADNIKRLRANLKLTQAQLGERAGLPRATVANLEQADSNPSVATMIAVAKALGVSLDELVTPPPEHRYYKVVAADMQEFRADHGRFVARLVSPIASKGVQVHHLTLLPGCNSVGRPHPQGAQEYFLTIAGTAALKIQDELVDVEAGTLVQFPGHHQHTYLNRDAIAAATAISVVVFQM
ncbi:MAG TPA: helix-turn-helix domain-containing protein [Planctomycetota bacterium]|nr:helix-turn-helix domain-containing protein [Planctomycetota bacterium]